MTRATFEGPILSGDSRFGPLRNVGYTQLNQYADIDLTNTTVATPLYSGSSGQFVNGNLIPNSNATVYTPSSSTYPSVAQTIPADSATNIYRGAVFYLPTGCDIDDILVDCAVVPAVSGGTSTFTSATWYFSNNYTAAGGTATYAKTGSVTAVGRQSLSTFTAAQLGNQTATSTDILQSGQPNLSQVVATLAIVGTNLDTIAATYTVAGAAIADTAGTFTCTSNAYLAVGQRLTISGTAGGTGSITGYTNPTSYLVSAVSGGAGTVTGFTLTTLTGAAIVTTAGTPTGLTYTIASSLIGRFYLTLRYTQPDNNIGTKSAYPYGTFM
jgi:hypothetical protein